MDFSESTFFKIFGVAVALFGTHGIVRNKLTVGFEGNDDYNRTVQGTAARVLSLAHVAAGCSFFFVDPIVGIIATCLLFALTWALGDPTE